MSRQTIKQMRAIASCMGITFAELIRRRFRKDAHKFDAITRDGATVTFKPRTFVDSSLPDNYQILPRTLIS